MSKQIQVERRSSFLDKLCKTVVEEEEEKRKKKERIAANKGTTPLLVGRAGYVVMIVRVAMVVRII